MSQMMCRYIVAASKCQQFTVVEQMTRVSNHLNVDKVMGFLMDAKLADSRPLINVCDRFDRVTELTRFLYENNLLRYIEAYVQKVNPSKTPQVVGGLLDCEADEEFISNLIMSVCILRCRAARLVIFMCASLNRLADCTREG
jgi:clathrin heavy chain